MAHKEFPLEHCKDVIQEFFSVLKPISVVQVIAQAQNQPLLVKLVQYLLGLYGEVLTPSIDLVL